ncbi:MAG: NAD(P)-binding domain-containing protein [Ignavibacteria bacterium]|jgi:pyrroline-5-carboxylate reductase|nr:NAD(P)-binding domain-containing protein [Ignavibacteria bacterium]MCU7501700.1 NAD(P)-binding domain-containing protein [Ignavibacteria bacterium]MCU7516893.1 NAD(P)-binding domain-containing protein [Ignavibacteria bacterium]
MDSKSYGFIGGGRITRIILKGLHNAGASFPNVIVSDIIMGYLEKLKQSYPEICISYNDDKLPARQDIVLISLHPPLILDLLKEIKPELKASAIIVSLAPKITIAKMQEALGGFDRITRVIPNAPSIVNAGYNPICFSSGISETEKSEILGFLSPLGPCPEVKEEKLEAYSLLTAMGPTYLWFQFYELRNILKEFGLNDAEIDESIKKMTDGALKTMFSSGMSPEEVMDLIPIKPIGDVEEKIKETYRNKLLSTFNRIKP